LTQAKRKSEKGKNIDGHLFNALLVEAPPTKICSALSEIAASH
jgi:hypothetical protein